MSDYSDVIDYIDAYIKSNGTNDITGPVLNAVLKYFADRVLFYEKLGGLNPQWTRVSDGTALASLAATEFSVDSYATPTKVRFNVDALSPNSDFTDLLEQVSEGSVISLVNLSDATDFLIFSVSSRSTYEMTGTAIMNELKVNGGDNYAFTFDFSSVVETDVINNYFVSSFADLQTAVTSANAIGGGNIYCTGDIIFTSNVSWDLTGITFIGFKAYWKMLNSNGVSDGTTAYKITITDGHPTFKNIIFSGSAGSTSNTFQSYSSREIFLISSDRIDITFDGCSFSDILGGLGSNFIMEYTVALLSGSTSILNFRNCTFSSHNTSSNTAFDSNGFVIYVANSTSDCRFILNVTNQLSSLPLIMSNSTDKLFTLDVEDGSNFLFYSDGSAFVEGGDVSAANTENIITKAFAGTSLLGNEKFGYSDENNIFSELPFYSIPLIYMPLNQQLCKPTTVSGTPTAYQFSLDNADPSLATSFKIYVNDSALDAWKLLSTSHLIVIRLGLSYASFQVSGAISFSGNVITVPVTSSNTNIDDYTTNSSYFHNISFIQ